MDVATDLLGIIGGFLLAVEAIKLENLSKLRKKYLNPFRQTLNPEIQWIDEINLKEARGGSRHFVTLFVSILISGSLFFILVLRNTQTILNWYTSFNIVIEVLLFLFISTFCGVLIWTGLIYVTKSLEHILYKIERNTSNGIIGILGFVFTTASIVIKWF